MKATSTNHLVHHHNGEVDGKYGCFKYYVINYYENEVEYVVQPDLNAKFDQIYSREVCNDIAEI